MMKKFGLGCIVIIYIEVDGEIMELMVKWWNIVINVYVNFFFACVMTAMDLMFLSLLVWIFICVGIVVVIFLFSNFYML